MGSNFRGKCPGSLSHLPGSRVVPEEFPSGDYSQYWLSCRVQGLRKAGGLRGEQTRLGWVHEGICPGGVHTPMVREMRPDIDGSDLIRAKDVAEWVVFLLSRRGSGVVDEVNIRREGKKPWE